MSSSDLIVDYYQRDLDAAEEEALGRLLESSPAEAERFAALAAADYRRFGLPEPDPRGGSRALWAALAVLGLGLAGWATWSYWSEAPAPRPVMLIQEDSGAFDVVEPQALAVQSKPGPDLTSEPAVPRPAAVALLQVRALSPRGPFVVGVSHGRIGDGAVHDHAGRRIADLRRLDPARLRWDGRVDGRLAGAGAYQFRVNVDGVELKQWVEIEVR